MTDIECNMFAITVQLFDPFYIFYSSIRVFDEMLHLHVDVCCIRVFWNAVNH